LVARIAGARVIVHAHSGRIDLWLRTPLRRLLVRLALAPASRVLTVSETSRKFLARSLGSARVILVDNGVDPAAYTPVAAPGHRLPTILFAGVLSPRKGMIDLIQASTELQRRGVAHQLVVAGGAPEEGPQAEAETREAASHGAPARFIGTQPHEEMARLYRGADVFCLPSWWEAMPLTVLEAMASGLPVVASTVGDIPRAVEEGVTGRLVSPQQPAALANALDPLLRDPALRTSMGEAGRRRVEQLFNIHGTAQATTCDVDHDYASMIQMADGGAVDQYLQYGNDLTAPNPSADGPCPTFEMNPLGPALALGYYEGTAGDASAPLQNYWRLA